MTRTTTLLCLAGAATVLACGGSAPGLSHRVPMKKIWHTPPEQRSKVAAAHLELQQTHANLDHNQFLLEDTDRELQIARAERSREQQDVRIAELRVERRKASYLAKLADDAAKAVTSSRNSLKAMDRKISWLEARKHYLRLEVDYLEAESLAAEARFELAKAELATQKGASPKKDLQRFKDQASSTKSRASSKRNAAQSARQRAASAEKAFRGNK